MAIRNVAPDMGPRTATHVMGAQDAGKGDARSAGTVAMGFRIPRELEAELRSYSEAHHVSMTTLVVEGLDWRLSH